MVNESMESDGIFDFEQAFDKLNGTLSKQTEALTQLMNATKPKETDEKDEEKENMAKRIKELEDKEKEQAIDEFSKEQDNPDLKKELADFSADQINKLSKMTKNKTVSFGKTLKGKEDGKDNSKKIDELKTQEKDFTAAGLDTEEVHKKITKLEEDDK